MKIVYLGGKQAGCVGLLTVLAASYEVIGVVNYGDMIRHLTLQLGLASWDSVKSFPIPYLLSRSDILVCVHGREIVPKGLLELPRIGCINVHPCLSQYKGANPVQRLLADGGKIASVGVHRMTEVVDGGEVLAEMFVDIGDCNSVEEIYNELYPYYSIVLLEALRKL